LPPWSYQYPGGPKVGKGYICDFPILFQWPFKVYDQQASWPPEGPPSSLARASLVTVIQLAHVCALAGVLNFFLLSAVRKHLDANPACQEKILTAYFTPLVVADFTHILITFWALGEERWDWRKWSFVLWSTVVLGISLLIPRVAWHLGIGRYVDTRDRHRAEKTQ
jgi:hypothetical protein